MKAFKYSLLILALTTSLAEADLIPLTTGFVTTQATDPTEAFTFHGSPYAHKFLRVGALVPGQASGTSVSGPLDSDGSFTVAFRDTPSGQVADVTFDLLGTPETLAGFIAVAPLGRGNFYAVTLDEALQGTFTVNAPVPPQGPAIFRPIGTLDIITCEGVCGPAGTALPDSGTTVTLLMMVLAVLGVVRRCMTLAVFGKGWCLPKRKLRFTHATWVA